MFKKKLRRRKVPCTQRTTSFTIDHFNLIRDLMSVHKCEWSAAVGAALEPYELLQDGYSITKWSSNALKVIHERQKQLRELGNHPNLYENEALVANMIIEESLELVNLRNANKTLHGLLFKAKRNIEELTKEKYKLPVKHEGKEE